MGARRASGLDISWAPLWWAPLTEVQHHVVHSPTPPRAPRLETIDAAIAAAFNALERLDAAVGHARGGHRQAATALIDAATELLQTASAVSEHFEQGNQTYRPHLSEMLGRKIGHFEASVLTGEASYEIDMNDAHLACEVSVAALDLLRDDDPTDDATALLGLRESAADLAALLVRAAGNLEVDGLAGRAPQTCPLTVHSVVEASLDDILRAARQGPGPPRLPEDPVLWHLEAIRATTTPTTTFDVLEDEAASPAQITAALAQLRLAWVQVAAHQVRAVRGLDEQLPASTYPERFRTLRAVVAAGTVNVLRSSRLIDRAQDVPQRRVWEQQHVGIAHAQDAYSRAVASDDLSALELTQLIVLTRLIRATMALTVAVLHPSVRR